MKAIGKRKLVNGFLSMFAAAFMVATAAPNVALAQDDTVEQVNELDELNPFDPNIEEKLAQMDAEYQEETGMSPYAEGALFDVMPNLFAAGCYRQSCPVWAVVRKSEQRLYLYVNGALQYTWAVSTGRAGFTTPNFDRHPNGRIYDRYTSSKYPGGDYNGMGNMPYAVFIQGGFAIHGTGQGNWPRLGRRDSHGCIRLHPDNAYVFNRLVRRNGIANTWITVQ